MGRKRAENDAENIAPEKASAPAPAQENKGKKRKKMSRGGKIAIAVVSVVLVLALVATGLWMFLRKEKPLVIDEGYGSVSYPLEEGETYSPDSEYEAYELFGRLNWKFRQHTNWYAEVHGEVDTLVKQDVRTFKQFDNGILISADVTRSSMVNAARQFCYMEDRDRVVWREAAGGPSTYNGMDTPWKTGEPYANMNIYYHEDANNNGKLDPGEDKNGNGKLEIGFKATCGLPAYELTVYVIDKDTIVSSEVIDNGDGTYTLKLELDPKIYLQEDGSYRGATTYYANQMKFTGGLTSAPTFDEIHASFTFDANFDIVRTNIEERYTATMGVTVPCSATSQTDYEFDTEKAKSDAYETYFKKYMDMEADSGPIKQELTATECLGQAFGPILAGPGALKVDLDLNGDPMEGVVYLDLHMGDELDLNAIEARASIGSFSLYLDKGTAYVSADKYKLSVPVSELADLFLPDAPAARTLLAKAASEEESAGMDILAQLAAGQFDVYERDRTATLSATIELGELQIPVEFNFLLEEDGSVSLDNVSAEIDGNEISLDAKIAFTELSSSPAPLPEADKAGYVGVGPYVDGIYGLVTSDVLHADISYEDEEHGITVSGGADLSLGEKTASGELTVSYGEKAKRAAFSYADRLVCLDLDGLKLSANVIDAIALISRYLPIPRTAAEEGFSVQALLEKLFDGTIADLADISEGEHSLDVAIRGTALLAAFGVSFDLGDVGLSVKEDVISLSARGVSVTIGKGSSVKTDTVGYTDIMPVASKIADLFSEDAIGAHLTYKGGELTVSADLDLMLDPTAVSGTLHLTYRQIDKQLSLQYAAGEVYLKIGELKVKLAAQDAVLMVGGLIGAPQSGEETDLLERLFSFSFGDILKTETDDDAVSLILKGTDLMQKFGLSFELGDIAISLTDDGLAAHADAFGASLTVGAGTAFETDTENYVDASPVILELPALLNAQGISLGGALELNAQDTAVQLRLEDGRISWKNGFELYIDAVLSAAGSDHEIEIAYAGGTLNVAYEGIGVEVDTSKLGELEAALFGLYQNIRATIDEVLTDPKLDPLPELRSFSDLLGLIQGPAMLAEAAGDTAGETDWTGFVQGIEIVPSEKKGGILCITIGAFTIDLMQETEEDGWLALAVSYGGEDAAVQVSGDLRAKACEEELPAMPDDTTYLTVDEMKYFLGYLGSAVDLLKTPDLTLNFTGKVTSTDAEKYPPQGEEAVGVKYDIDATMSTHRGSASLIHLDVDGKDLWVDTEVFAHASINVTAKNEADTSIFIDLFILDAAPDGTDDEGNAKYAKDGYLDFYVTLSQYGPVGSTADTVPGYNPVRLYAPSSEILTILSAALPMLGVDVDILNNYMIEKWLTLENVAQLKAFGSIVSPLLSGLIGGMLPASPAAIDETGPSADVPSEAPAFSLKALFKQFDLKETGIEIVLDSKTVYGLEGLENVKATLTKTADTADEDGNITYGKFTALDLLNIYDRAGTENTSLKGEIRYDEVETALPVGEYQSFLGAEKLILALAKSATHIEDGDDVISGESTSHTYAVNRNFYIDGNITADLNLINIITAKVNIHLIALSVTIDESGELGINVRLEYNGVQKLNQVVINGDSEVDLTIKGGMVYIKRVQKKYYDPTLVVGGWKDYATPITLYRAMPMASFTGDMLGQLGFILNFGSIITNNLKPNGSSSETPAEKIDFGQRLQDVLKAYTYTEAVVDGEGKVTTPASWDLTLNGDALVKGILGDINLTIAEDEDGYIRDLTANTTIVTVIKANVNLRWRNSGGTMETDKESGAQVQDLTTDISEKLSDAAHGLGGMIEKLNAEDGWTETSDEGNVTYKFLEAQEKTVTYKYRAYGNGEEKELDTQQVMVSTGNDSYTPAANILYSVLQYPELPDDGREYYVEGMEKVEVGEQLSDELFAQQYKHTYEVKFWADESLGELWKYDETENKWWYSFDMEYGAKVTFMANGEEFHDAYTVTDSADQEITLPARPAYEGGAGVSSRWAVNFNQTGTEFSVLYDLDTVQYHSDVQFTVEGNANHYNDYSEQFTDATHTLMTPTAVEEGYTFLGWYAKDVDGNWTQIDSVTKGDTVTTTTVEALWMKNITIDITTATRTRSGVITKYYTHTVEATLSGGELVGACAEEVEYQVSTQVTFKAGDTIVNESSYKKLYTGDVSGSNQDVRSTGNNAVVEVVITYTIQGSEKTCTFSQTKSWK